MLRVNTARGIVASRLLQWPYINAQSVQLWMMLSRKFDNRLPINLAWTEEHQKGVK